MSKSMQLPIIHWTISTEQSVHNRIYCFVVDGYKLRALLKKSLAITQFSASFWVKIRMSICCESDLIIYYIGFLINYSCTNLTFYLIFILDTKFLSMFSVCSSWRLEIQLISVMRLLNILTHFTFGVQLICTDEILLLFATIFIRLYN